MKHTFILLVILMASLGLTAQEKYTVSGTITDAETGETLIGANVIVQGSTRGTTSNEYGFYSLSVPAGDSLTLMYSYVGFGNHEIPVYLRKDSTINVALGQGIEIEEVVVKANSYREQLNSTEMSVEALTMKEAKVIPAVLGEVDILKTMQLKPGIASGSEGSSGLFVRGGGNDQNLIILDEAVVYNPNHLFGFFSTFNSDAVKNLTAYKGGFPAQYGGRLSSVIDVKLKEGNNQQFTGTGGVGLITSRLTLEGPIEKGQSSYIISGRRTYADLITAQINKANEDDPDYNPIPDYFFYDLNTKVNFQLGENDHLYLSGYFGRDEFAFSDEDFDFNFNWGNATGTARWNHIFHSRLFANTTFTYSDYEYNIVNDLTGFTFRLGSDIRDANLKVDFYNALQGDHSLRFGAGLTYHEFEVGRLKFSSDDNDISFSAGQNFEALESYAYISDEWTASDKLKLNMGFRLSGFHRKNTNYIGWEPRLSARYLLSEDWSLKGSYARMYQYVHLVSNSGIALPTDIWYPSTERVKPQTSDQVAVGYEVLLGTEFLLTNEYYYKWLDNRIDFKDHAQLFANEELEEEFRFGNGRAYGMELSLERKEGKFRGWIGYTLAFVENRFDGIMNGEYYSPRYDRRHDLSIVAMYEVSKRLELTATFVYGSGDRTWLPEGRTILTDIDGAETVPALPVYGDRNNLRLPDYHRLDLGVVWYFFPSWGEHNLTFSVYNTYNRRNAYFLYLDAELEELDVGGETQEFLAGVKAKQVSLFPILPALTWNFKF